LPSTLAGRPVVPGWSPFLGQVRLAGLPSRPFLRKLGQEAPPPSPQDLPRVISTVEFASQDWTKDQAIEAFNLTNLVQAVMEKLAFSRSVFTQIQSQPTVLAAMTKAGAAQALNQTVTTLNDLLKRATLPNAMASTRNLQNALEVNILPKWGVGVKGIRPLFRAGTSAMPAKLDSVSTDTSSGKSEVLNFGDLTTTSVETDMAALKAASSKVQDIAPDIKLSGSSLGIEPITITVVSIIAVASILITWMVTSTIKSGQQAAKPPVQDPDTMDRIQKLCNSLPPELAAACWGNVIKNNNFWNGSSSQDVWMYVGIGVVGLLGIWMVTSFIKAVKE